MSRPSYWVVDGTRFRPVAATASHEPAAVCLHAHSCHSVENLAHLNWVSRIPWFRPFSRILQRSFGLAHVPDVDYRKLCYHPPITPGDIWDIELAGARRLGFERVLVAVTDHDEVAGSLELVERRGEDAARIGAGEELSFLFEHELFHVGISGVDPRRLPDVHASLQPAAAEGRIGDIFDLLTATGCLVVLNHPLIAWGAHHHQDAGPVEALIGRFGWAIDALEFNAMRSQAENRRVVELAGWAHKPLVGGGDSHLPAPASALCASNAGTYAAFIDEVRSGWSRPIVTREYFLPHRWKITLRVLNFIARYRAIGEYDGVSVGEMLAGRRVLLDPVGAVCRAIVGASRRVGAFS